MISAHQAMTFLGEDIAEAQIGGGPESVTATDLRPPESSSRCSLVFTVRPGMALCHDPAIWICPTDESLQPRAGRYAKFLCARPKATWAKLVWKFFRNLVEEAERHPLQDFGARIHSSAQIGSAGLGVTRDQDGKAIDIPHTGRVVLQKGVSVGANSVIHRAVLGSTEIGKDTRIGAMVNVGHGVQVGERCLIAPMTTIGGSVRMGNNVTIWQGVTIANKVKIGDGAVIGMGSVLLSDVPAGETWMGAPAARSTRLGKLPQ